MKSTIESEAQEARDRDRADRQSLIESQTVERRRLQAEIGSLRFKRELEFKKLNRDMAAALSFDGSKPDKAVRQTLRQRMRRNRDHGPLIH